MAVSPDVVFHPEKLTADQILTEPNVELRRVLVERVGCEELLEKAGATIQDEDTDAGGRRQIVELMVTRPGFSARSHRYLFCRCPSTGREYLLRVPPTVETCHQAVAWLAGFDDPQAYRPIQET